MKNRKVFTIKELLIKRKTMAMLSIKDTFRKLGLFSMLLTLSHFSYNQEIKYDELIVEVKQLSPKQRYSKFFEYQKQDPHFANTYIQLGDASEKIFLEIDPLRSMELSNYWVNNAILYYGLFPVYLKPNEVRRNREYYDNFPIETQERRIENEDVFKYVESRIAFCKNYKDSLSLIYSALEKSKDHYNSCVKIFNELNEKYDNLNHALLQTNPEFLSLLNKLESDYKSTLEEFTNYQMMISKFPIGEYKQEFQIVPIQTFRLDGLTNSDFLKNSFTIWNYGKWVEDYRKTFNNDIVPLRSEINAINKTFNDNKRRLLIVESFDEEQKLKSYDDLFMFRLGKFDNNSLVRDLFRYLNTRQEFLILGKSSQNSPNDSSSVLMNRKFRYYHGLAIQKLQTEEMLDLFNKAITKEKVEHFSDFFSQNYQGEQGLRAFYTQEGNFLDQTLDQSFDNLKTYLSNEFGFQRNLGTGAGAKGISIPLYSLSLNDPEYSKFTHVTQGTYYIQGALKYTYGLINRLGRKPLAFIAKIGDEKKVEWIREIGEKGKSILPNGDYTAVLHGFDNGSIAIVSGKVDNIHHNTIVKLDNAGKEIINKSLDIHQKPTFVKFDEINQLSLMAFGLHENDSLNYLSSLTICQADSAGNITWKLPFEVQGNLVDIIKSGDNYLAFINYKSYFFNGARSESNNWGMLILTLMENGEITNILPFNANTDYHIDKAFVISNDEISLIGYASEPGDKSGKLRYLVINPEGKVKYKNF